MESFAAAALPCAAVGGLKGAKRPMGATSDLE